MPAPSSVSTRPSTVPPTESASLCAGMTTASFIFAARAFGPSHRTGPLGSGRPRSGRLDRGPPALDVPLVDLAQDVVDPVLEPPVRIVAPELAEVADPPAMV